MSVKDVINKANRIYSFLADAESKYIFRERLLYSLTSDSVHVVNVISTLPEGKRFVEIMSEADNIYLFGAGTWGREIAKIWPDKLKGFLDNNANIWGKEIEGIQVLKPEDVITDDFDGKILISTRLYYKDIYEQLISLGGKSSNIINVGEVLDALAERQYFDLPTIPRGNAEVFADVGSLDAMSAIRFINWSDGKFEKVYCFEPDDSNVLKCKKNLMERGVIEKAEIIHKGAWCSEGKLSFNAKANGNSSFVIDSDEADEVVEVTTLDSVFKEKKVTFIKMDIEGAELEALKGCEQLIKTQKPKLAICIYHKPEDVIEIPDLILSYNSSYKFYIRHYSVTDSETVLYAI